MKFIKFLFFILLMFCFSFIKVDKSFAYELNNVLDFNKLNEQIIRFHVIANSNSDFDQNLKHKVKDEVLTYISKNYDLSNSKEENMETIMGILDKIKEVSQNVLIKNGVDYKVNVKLEKKYIEERIYEGYVVPAGIYDSFVIYLGEAEGKNFWSMIFSSIGFIHDKDDNIKNKSMINLVKYNKNESREVFSNNSVSVEKEVNVTFKVFEIVKNIIKKIF